MNDERTLFLADQHLGTQGDGNHFTFVGRGMVDRRVYLITHHGSRGVGSSLYNLGLLKAQRYTNKVARGIPLRLSWLNINEDEGKEYWHALQLVREWTRLNHEIIHREILSKARLENRKHDSLWNEHNFVFRLRDEFFHAKGATPMDPKFRAGFGGDSRRILPFSMGDPILFVKHNNNSPSEGFGPHGAGRNLSRSAFLKKIEEKVDMDLEAPLEGLDIRYYTGNPDLSEHPYAYKPYNVVRYQIEKEFQLVSVDEAVAPYGCMMMGRRLE